MSRKIEFTIEFRDNATGAMKRMGLSVRDAEDAIRQLRGSIDGLDSGLVNAGQIATVFESATSVISQLNDTISNLAAGYNDYIVAETRLAQVMRNTMDASDAEIQSIVELCAAQQQLGVVEDDVTMAGAQELATYLGLKSSLEVLIPVLNDMLAQQYGVNASQEAAISIGSMLGKVMEGQTSALSRYGYFFDEAQEKILKFGSEEEKAAVLADVVTNSVGGMNEALAATDAGKQKQVQMALDGVSDSLGRIGQGIMPFLKIASSAGIAVMGAMQLRQAFTAITAAIRGSAAASALAALHDKVLTAARTMLTAATGSATVGTVALTVAVTALYAALTFGLSAIITALVALFSSMGSTAETSAKQLQSLQDAEDAFSQASGDARGELSMHTAQLKQLIDTNGDTRQAVADLNAEYGDIFGTYSTAAQWYDVLVSKSELYCQQIGYEAQAKVLAQRKAEAELQKISTQAEMDAMFYGTDGKRMDVKAYNRMAKEVAALDYEITVLGNNFDRCTEKMAEASIALSSGQGVFNAATASYSELGREIELIDNQLKNLAPSETAEIARLKALRNAYKGTQDALGSKLGITDSSKESSSDKGKELIEDAKTYKEIGNNISYYKEQLDLLGPAELGEAARIGLIIQSLEQQQEQLRLSQRAAASTYVDENSSLDEISEALSIQQALRGSATRENIANIDTEIERLNALKKAIEESSIAPPGNISKLNTISQLNDAISYYNKSMDSATVNEIGGIKSTIDALQTKKDAMMQIASLPQIQQDTESLAGLSGQSLAMQLQLIGAEEIEAKIRSLQDLLNNTQNPLGDEQRKEVEGLLRSWQNYETILSDFSKRGDAITGTLGNLGAMMSSLSGVVGEGAAGWLTYGSNLLNAVAQALPAIAQVIGGNIAQAFAGAAAQSQTVPFPFNLVALAASMAAVTAAVASIPKFADGGIAYGPTLGIFGEYAGASSNPEVVAPLSRLKGLIADTQSTIGGEVVFRISGRELVGILNKRNNMIRRTR